MNITELTHESGVVDRVGVAGAILLFLAITLLFLAIMFPGEWRQEKRGLPKAVVLSVTYVGVSVVIFCGMIHFANTPVLTEDVTANEGTLRSFVEETYGLDLDVERSNTPLEVGTEEVARAANSTTGEEYVVTADQDGALSLKAVRVPVPVVPGK